MFGRNRRKRGRRSTAISLPRGVVGGRVLDFESLEMRRMLDGSGLPGNDCPPDLDLSAVPDQTVVIGETLTLDLLSAGGTLTDLDDGGQPTGDVLRLMLDPDSPEDVPLGVSMASGVITWTPTASQIGTRTIVVIGVDSGSPALADAEVLTVHVIEPGNQVPVVDLNGDGEGVDTTASFVEDGGAVAIVDAALAISDADDTELHSASVAITNLADGTAELLSVDTGSTSILDEYDSVTGILSLSGADSIAAYEQVLRSLVYNNTSQNPTATDRVITVTVDDGSDTSDPAKSTVTITPQNDSPDLAAIGDESTLVDQQVEVTVTATDPDGDNLIFQIDEAPNTSAVATIEQTSNTTAVVRWTPAASDGLGDFEFRILVTDDDALPLVDSEAFTITVTTPVEAAAPSAVLVNGDALPVLPTTGADPAIGLEAPEFATLTNTGESTDVAHDGSVSTLIGFVAHWCPHCQEEIPRVVDWLDTNELPENVQLVLVSTAVDAGRSNFPPSQWLVQEDWPLDVLIDSQDSAIAVAHGLPAFPYWVSLDADGKVITRHAGQATTEEFTNLVNRTAAGE